MSLMQSRQPKTYRWQKGDLITAQEACELLGYKSKSRLQDASRRKDLQCEFEELGCTLTLGLAIGQQQRFLRSEIEAFIDAKIEAAQTQSHKRQNNLRLAA